MISDKLRKIRSGDWSFFYDNRFIDLPYELKNDYVDELSSAFEPPDDVSQTTEWMWSGSVDWKARLGTRKIDVRANGTLHEREKGVDTQLVIHACSLAMDASVRWVCLVTNDSDYVPLVHHLHHHAKSVYWLSYAGNRARDMVKAIGLDNVIDKAHLQSGYSDRSTFDDMQKLLRRSVAAGKDTSSNRTLRLFNEDPAIERSLSAMHDARGARDPTVELSGFAGEVGTLKKN